MFEKGILHLSIYILLLYYFGFWCSFIAIPILLNIFDFWAGLLGYYRMNGNDLAMTFVSETGWTNISGYFVMQRTDFEGFKRCIVQRFIDRIPRASQVITKILGVYFWKNSDKEVAKKNIILENKIIKTKDELNKLQQMYALVQLDRSKPMYEFRFIKEFRKDESAVIYIINHAYWDGMGFASLMSWLSDDQFSAKNVKELYEPHFLKRFLLSFFTPFVFIKSDLLKDKVVTSPEAERIRDTYDNRPNKLVFFESDSEVCLDTIKKVYKTLPGMTLNDYLLGIINKSLYESFQAYLAPLNLKIDNNYIKTHVPVSIRGLPKSYSDKIFENCMTGRGFLLPLINDEFECMKEFKPKLKSLLDPSTCWHMYNMSLFLSYVPSYFAKKIVGLFGTGFDITWSNIIFSNEPFCINGSKVTKIRFYDNGNWSSKVKLFVYTYMSKVIVTWVSRDNLKMHPEDIFLNVIKHLNEAVDKVKN